MNAQADHLSRFRTSLSRRGKYQAYGRLLGYNGLVMESHGPDAKIGELCEIALEDGSAPIAAEVVGFRDGHVLLMPFGHLRGIAAGARIRSLGSMLHVPVGKTLLGRVVDAFGAPLDGGAPIAADARWAVFRSPIHPLQRAPLDTPLETGVRAIDGVVPLAKGQRVGIFAGSGVGKSTLLGMIAGRVAADVVVVAMVGERGREVADFLEQALPASRRDRAVVMVATAEQPALVRTHAVHAAHAVAEYFREQGNDVLLIVDSITRFAMAQREVGLAVGEPPTSRGYPPSVFNLLPQILERGGRIRDGGSISAIYSVLVEGDDMNEPVADHMRAILDGHLVLSRKLGTRGQLPAIDLLASVSRLADRVTLPRERELIKRVKAVLATFEESRDLIDLGAYQPGSNPELDEAIRLHPLLSESLRQAPSDWSSREDGIRRLADIVGEGTR